MKKKILWALITGLAYWHVMDLFAFELPEWFHVASSIAIGVLIAYFYDRYSKVK